MTEDRSREVYSEGAGAQQRSNISKAAADCINRVRKIQEAVAKSDNHPYTLTNEWARIKRLMGLWSELGGKHLSDQQVIELFRIIQKIKSSIETILAETTNYNLNQSSVDQNTASLTANLLELENVHSQVYPHAVIENYETFAANENPARQETAALKQRVSDLDKRLDELNRTLGASVQQSVAEHYDKQIKPSIDGRIKSLDEQIIDYGNVRSKLHDTNTKLLSIESQASEILRNAKESGMVSAIGKRANEFKSMYEHADKDAARWIKSAVAFAAIAIALLVYFSHAQTIAFEKFTSLGVLQLVAPRATLVAGLLFVAIYSLKMHRTFRHQSEVYRLKRTALLSAYRMYESSDDKEFKQAMLGEASKTIFSQTPTGLLNAEEEHAEKRIMEILRAFKN